MDLVVIGTCEKICREFCKYNGTQDENNQCEYMRKHCGNCPLDIIIQKETK